MELFLLLLFVKPILECGCMQLVRSTVVNKMYLMISLVRVQLSSFQWYAFSCGFTFRMSFNIAFLFTASISAF